MLVGRQSRYVDPEIDGFSVQRIIAMPIESPRDLVQEIATVWSVGICAHNWGIHHEIHGILLNGVSMQTSPTLDTSRICWQSMIPASFIPFPHTLMTNLYDVNLNHVGRLTTNIYSIDGMPRAMLGQIESVYS